MKRRGPKRGECLTCGPFPEDPPLRDGQRCPFCGEMMNYDDFDGPDDGKPAPRKRRRIGEPPAWADADQGNPWSRPPLVPSAPRKRAKKGAGK
jgi:hypothetical protein